ncbi:hypothetical protein bplSymb_SCF05902P013 [Bathymodiolus platifrons methanotrophic gill symbiont]|uniref:hypothetical protein n=1 Tax=Bathymodiolus platifrons methanotrophic gill symbiont TaxID=113268 RepID=UPI000B40D663|nr:hypothetical protein [Bathymodiolus platifrons methanotrophic gill symbiont]TXK93869.1 hypothetical protein BMR02_14605 [Methylococcaceae bacterium HT1]TXL12406.1 hypothetical protein BMR05_15465 [Methylococcaceae bacterium HT4]TXL20038.1 hypothetical protein BMR03_14740 [Methylococcaceae bacterium HT2]GAW87147.1 hypothetical protein bplSymb_SCF05902P013 [Bathymodiolus platifrons methanotrophic gill symbiont]GFO75187.1 hypothetical protein BPLS_P2259 [Bathymodiolus platifrons methanotrophic
MRQNRLQSENQALADERKQEIDKLTQNLKQERNASEDARLKLTQKLNKTELLIQRTNSLESGVIELKNDLKQSDDIKNQTGKELAVVEAKFQAEKEKSGGLEDQLNQKETDFAQEKVSFTDLLKTKAVQSFEGVLRSLRRVYDGVAKWHVRGTAVAP